MSYINQHEMNEQGNRESQYKTLCADVKNAYLTREGDLTEDPKRRLIWNTSCDGEINLWTYWQGRKTRNPKIMLVGQDWGCTNDAPQVMKNIEAMNLGEECRYCDNVKLSPTDKHLTELFEVLGYDDITKNNYRDLFFTNLVLGYRAKGTSGNCSKQWIKNDLGFFNRLVCILQPQIILCLGRATFEGVLEAFGMQSPVKRVSFNGYIEKREATLIDVGAGRKASVFPLAHCGAMGTMNRNAKCGKSSTDLSKQIEDWKYIAKCLSMGK